MMKGKVIIFLLIVALVLLGAAVLFHRTQPTVTVQPSPGLESRPTEVSAQKASSLVADTNAGTDGNHELTAPSDTVLLILDEQADQRARFAAARKSLAKMSDTDRQSLFAFLLQPINSDKNQEGQVLKNLVMDQLCALNPPPAGLGDVLTKMYEDRNQNVVLRDYAVQHMVDYSQQVQRAGDHSQLDKQKELSQIQNALWEAVNETGSSLAGTALLSLQQLSEDQAGFEKSEVSARALQLAGDNDIGQMTRITAIQLCARNGLKESIPMIQAVALHSQSVPMRISAIGALGSLGGTDQIPFLTSLLNEKEERLMLPIQQALNRLRQ